MADREARSSLLRSKVHAFCQAFLESKPPRETLDTYFTPNPKITEHGPTWASRRLPFLGRTFHGRRSSSTSSRDDSSSTCDDYFSLLASTLSFHPDKHTFPPSSDFIVDATAGGTGAVSVVAHAKFASVASGQSWEENFIYRISEFDEDGRIGHWEIWADPLSAWEAVVEHDETRKLNSDS
ncbi:hypothetical protein MMC13_002170 [Lambiella insularis]|nr:hypothetical protein [Lambiella insularis]